MKALIAIGFIGMAGVALAQEREPTAMQSYRNAESYVAARQWDLALAALDACIARDPSITDAYYLRGTVRERFHRDEAALTDYNIYVELRPNETEALFARAQLRFRLKRYEEARADFLKLTYLPNLETNSVFFQVDTYTGATSSMFTMQGANKAYIFNYLGQTETHLYHLKEAIQWFDSAISRVNGDPDIYVNRGIAKQKSNDIYGAMRDFRKALQLNPNHALAKHHLGTASKSIHPDSSSAMLDEAIADNPNMPFAYAERGYARMEKRQYREALEDYNQAIRLDPSNPEYFLNRGLIREKVADPEGAYKDYTQAISLRADFYKAWLNRGNLLFRRGKLIEAVEDYSVAITYNARYSSAYYNRAVALDQLHQSEAACGDLNTAEALGYVVEAKVKRQICR